MAPPRKNSHAPRKMLATKAARKSSYDSGGASATSSSAPRKNWHDRVDFSQPPKKKRTKRISVGKLSRKVQEYSPPRRKHPFWYEEEEDDEESEESEEDEEEDDVSSVLSDSFVMQDLNDKETKAANAERKRQERRPLPPRAAESEYQELQNRVHQFKFPKRASEESLENVASKLETIVSHTRRMANQCREENKATTALPNWISQTLPLTRRLELRNPDSAEKASKAATDILLEYLDANGIADAWKNTIDCKCEMSHPFHYQGQCPCRDWDCDGTCWYQVNHLKLQDPECLCSARYLETVQEGLKGYLLVKIYGPIMELLQFANSQPPALKGPLRKGCFDAVRGTMALVERKKENSMAIFALKLILKNVEQEHTTKQPQEAVLSSSTGSGTSQESVIGIE